MTSALTIPTIHLNGTDAQRLLDALDAAGQALQQAQAALAQCTPNGRDYYVQAAGAFPKAIAEHEKRIDALRQIRHELEIIADGIIDQQIARGKQ